MELTVQNVYGLLLRSKLMSVDEARSMFVRWQQEAKDSAGNLAQFASWMVAQKYLTEYQAQLLARGHAEGFFLNEYKILERLGKGRMAGVYKAQHPLGQIVAIKVLPPSKAQDANMLGRFHREARLALRLKHPNIVRTFQTGAVEDLHYIVMEYLEGETLEEVLTRRGKLPPGEAVRLVHQALQGLQHIHAQGLVHRDLKPSNMMLIGSSPDGTIDATLKLLDIGLGRMLFDETADTENLTSEGVLLGTPDYMSPEQARDPRTIDIRSDIYSLGCVLYHLLSGQPPFPDTNIISQMIRHATETPKPLKVFNPAVPDGLQQIVNWMMAKEAAQRYPTPERAAQALQVFLIAGDEPLAAPEADPRMRPYLSWLEEDSGRKSAAAAAPTTPSQKPPSGSTLPAAKPSKPAAKTHSTKEHQLHSSKRSKKKHRPAPPPSGGAGVSPAQGGQERRDTALTLPPSEQAEQIDVELVAPHPSAGETNLVGRMRLSRREIVIFGIGALLGAVVTFLGALLAFMQRE
jgi:eukaryotic-like serine/threonine-protein kinase